jgi:glucose/arabinose dehydrogenase
VVSRSEGGHTVRGRIVVGLVILVSLQAGPSRAAPAAIGAEPVVTGLDFPGPFTFAPDGRIFYAETYLGEIHLYDPSSGSDTLFFTLTGDTGVQGILGLALAPTYPAKPYLYAYVTRDVQGVLTDHIVRIRDSGGIGTQPRLLYQATAGHEHHGGRMLFGSDGMLYVVTGEEADPANAQDLASTLGKILRMTPNGQPAPGNPFGTLVWAYGLRNSFGWDFDPQTGVLWEADNGPECNDEINTILKGRNYGWGPSETCSTPPQPPRNTNQDGPNPILPVEYFATTTAPTGVAFCQGCGLTGGEGAMFYGNYNTFDIRQVTLSADRRHIASDVAAYVHPSFVLSIEAGPDGTLYFSDATAIYRLVQA